MDVTVTQAAVLFSDRESSEEAGAHLGQQILAALDGASPDAVVLFASSRHDYVSLLSAVQRTSRPEVLVGASSAGEFTGDKSGVGMACALALRADDMRFCVGVGRGVTASTGRRPRRRWCLPSRVRATPRFPTERRS